VWEWIASIPPETWEAIAGLSTTGLFTFGVLIAVLHRDIKTPTSLRKTDQLSNVLDDLQNHRQRIDRKWED